MKKDEIYRKFRQDIITGNLKEGDKLPTEFECASLFQVSRDTVREALKHLEKDGYIERVKAKGTFVKLPGIDSEDRNIYFLVPCYEYLKCSGLHTLNLLFELIAAAAVAGWRITPVIYSKTNDPNDICWENLMHFNSDSRIIVNHDWFYPYFETLTSIGARVAYIDNDCTPAPEISKHTKGWLNFVEQDRIGAKKALSYLQWKGCRNIALFMPNIDHPNNTTADEYRKYTERNGQKKIQFPTPRIVEPDQTAYHVSERVKDLADRNEIDGLLIHTNELLLPLRGTYHSSLGLPQDFPIVALPSQIDQIYSTPEDNIPILKFPLQKMAQDIVYCLTEKQYIPQTFRYEPELKLCGEKIL